MKQNQWYPFGYESHWVRHTECGGLMWHRMTPKYATFEMACAKCFKNFDGDQLELFCEETKYGS